MKFLLLNGLWLVVPWLVLVRGHRTVRNPPILAPPTPTTTARGISAVGGPRT